MIRVRAIASLGHAPTIATVSNLTKQALHEPICACDWRGPASSMCRSCYNKFFSLKGPKVSTCAVCGLAVDDWLYQKTIERYGQCYCPAHYQFAIEGRLIEADDPDALLERLLDPLVP